MAENVPFGQHPHDHPPADWVAYLEATQPNCRKCHVRPVHLPGAKTCFECLENRPGLARRRVMFGILHAGGFYCSSCYVRAAPEAGKTCHRCYHMRAADKLRREMNALLRRATVHFQVATGAAHIAVEEEDVPVQIALHEVMRADAASREAWVIVQNAQEVVLRMAAIHPEKAVAAGAELIHSLETAGEVANIVGNALMAVAARLAA